MDMDEMQARIQQLEAENTMLKDEVRQIRAASESAWHVIKTYFSDKRIKAYAPIFGSILAALCSLLVRLI